MTINPTQNALLSSLHDQDFRLDIENFIGDHHLDDATVDDLCHLLNDYTDIVHEKSDGTAAYQDGYDDGYNDANDNLKNDRDNAYQDGYDTGYREGFGAK